MAGPRVWAGMDLGVRLRIEIGSGRYIFVPRAFSVKGILRTTYFCGFNVGAT